MIRRIRLDGHVLRVALIRTACVATAALTGAAVMAALLTLLPDWAALIVFLVAALAVFLVAEYRFEGAQRRTREALDLSRPWA